MTILIDGIAVAGAPREIVNTMKEMSFDDEGHRGYKKAVRKRARRWYHEAVRTRSAEKFLEDLAELGEIYIIER